MADQDDRRLTTQPAELTDVQVETLANAANQVWADANHDDLCACDSWPTGCVNGHWVDEWRSGAAEVGMRALIGLWESMRAPSEAAELARLRSRVAELEALTPAAIQTCRVCGAGYDLGQPCSTCAFKAQMAAAIADRSGRETPEASRG